MADFSIPSRYESGAYKYRTIKLGDRGADVYALQTAVQAKPDGVFGNDTLSLVKANQRAMGLEDDGLAGPATQTALAVHYGTLARRKYSLPLGALYGQLKQESGFLLGNSSAPRPDGSRDRGVTQMNDALWSLEQAYNTPESIFAMAARIRGAYMEYRALGSQLGEDRLWDLAQGSWNAPSWTRTLAKGGQLSAAARAHIETYISHVTAYRR